MFCYAEDPMETQVFDRFGRSCLCHRSIWLQCLLAKKEYQSTSRIYVVSRQNQDNNALTNSDLQGGFLLG